MRVFVRAVFVIFFFFGRKLCLWFELKSRNLIILVLFIYLFVLLLNH